MCISTEIQKNALVKFIKANGSGMHDQDARVISINESQATMLFKDQIRVDDCCFYFFVDSDSFTVIAIHDRELHELRILDENKFKKVVDNVTKWLLS